MKCNKCGTELLPGDVFCSNCGKRTEIQDIATPHIDKADAPEFDTASEAQAASGAQSVPEKQSDLKKVSVIITAIAVVLALSAAVLYAVYYRPQKAAVQTAGTDEIRRSSAMEESMPSGMAVDTGDDSDAGSLSVSTTKARSDEITTVSKVGKTASGKVEKTTTREAEKTTARKAEKTTTRKAKKTTTREAEKTTARKAEKTTTRKAEKTTAREAEKTTARKAEKTTVKPAPAPKKYYVPNTIAVHKSGVITVNGLVWKKDSLTVQNVGDEFRYDFDGTGKIEYGENTDKNGNILTHSFSYGGDALSSLELTEQHRVTDDYTERLDSRAVFNSFGKPEYLLEQYLTSGSEANITYSRSGQVSAIVAHNSDHQTETHYYYEDSTLPDRLTRTELTHSDYKGTMVLSYLYNGDGTVNCIETTQMFDPDSSNIFRMPVDCSASFEYDENGNVSEFSFTETGGTERTVVIRFIYESATEAQYNAYRSISACSFNGLYPDMYLPFDDGSSVFPSVNVLIRPQFSIAE